MDRQTLKRVLIGLRTYREGKKNILYADLESLSAYETPGDVQWAPDWK